jgi:hypothetical protein
MVHRTVPRRVVAERYFPVRVRVVVPLGGFGSQLDLMREWLDYHAGRDCYFTGSETEPGRPDAALFCFLDAKMAAAFVDRFACGLIVGREPLAIKVER